MQIVILYIIRVLNLLIYEVMVVVVQVILEYDLQIVVMNDAVQKVIRIL